MKNLKNYIKESLNESITDSDDDKLIDILDAVIYWFSDNMSNGFDSEREKRKQLKAMANNENDIMIDMCIDAISDEYPDAEDFYDDIVDQLVELAKNEL